MSDLIPASSSESTRASDADRDRVLQVLAAATAEGRLTVDEHDDLTTRALHARTVGELQALTVDLAPRGANALAPAPAASAVVATGETSGRGFLAIFSARVRKGSWHVPTHMKATAVFGAIELDFRDAVFEASEVTCVANCVFGAVEITVPDWVRVVDDGTAIFGAREEDGPGAAEPTVTLHLKGFSVFGATEVKRKAPKLGRGRGKALGDGIADAAPGTPALDDARTRSHVVPAPPDPATS